MFRVRDLDNGMWVVADGDETSPTAEHKKDATVFEGEKWLRYWAVWEGVEIVPLDTARGVLIMKLSHPSALIVESGKLITEAYQECTDSAKKKRIAELLWNILEVAALVDGMTRDELHAKLLAEDVQIEMALWAS